MIAFVNANWQQLKKSRKKKTKNLKLKQKKIFTNMLKILR